MVIQGIPTNETVFIKLPVDLAHDLIEQQVAEPYLRQDRTDTSLLPQIVIAVSSAATTVIAAKLTADLPKVIAKAVKSRRHKEKDNVGVRLIIRPAGGKDVIEIEITEGMKEDEITRAVGDAQGSAGS
jgi:hypothetical protein